MGFALMNSRAARTLSTFAFSGVLSIVCNASTQVREVLHNDRRLKGVSAIQVDVLELGESDLRCGLTTDSLRLDASKAIMDGGLKVVTDGDFTLFVSATTIAPSSVCATALRVTLDTYVEALPSHSIVVKPGQWGVKYSGMMSLLEKMAVLSSASSEHGQRVRSALRDIATAFVTRIRLVNQ